MSSFDLWPMPRIVAGEGALARLGELTAELGGRRVVVVADPGIVGAGYAAQASESLRAAGIASQVFDNVAENPTTAHVRAGVAAARGADADLLIGLGGGSSIDCAKGINFLLTNGGEMADYRGFGQASQPMLPMIAVPTTAGTGSEAQSYALIADEATHVKMACGDRQALPRLAILDPLPTLTQPSAVTVATGLDALSHAVESAATTRRTTMSVVASSEAWRRLVGNFSAVIAHPTDVRARADMQLGACLAGAAIEQSMLGAAHSCANPLTARHGLVHGLAVAIMLPHVVRYNASAAGDVYGDLCAVAGWEPAAGEGSGERLATGLSDLLRIGGVSGCLADHGVSRSDVPALAAEASQQWTAQFNPRPVDTDAFAGIYGAALASS